MGRCINFRVELALYTSQLYKRLFKLRVIVSVNKALAVYSLLSVVLLFLVMSSFVNVFRNTFSAVPDTTEKM